MSDEEILCTQCGVAIEPRYSPQFSYEKPMYWVHCDSMQRECHPTMVATPPGEEPHVAPLVTVIG